LLEGGSAFGGADGELLELFAVFEGANFEFVFGVFALGRWFPVSGWRLLRNHFKPILLVQAEATQTDEVGKGLVEGSFMPGFIAAIEGVVLVVTDLGVGLGHVIGLESESAAAQLLVAGKAIDQVVFGSGGFPFLLEGGQGVKVSGLGFTFEQDEFTVDLSESVTKMLRQEMALPASDVGSCDRPAKSWAFP
jgi:hypothetical protein